MKYLKYGIFFVVLAGLFSWAGHGLYKKHKKIEYEIFNLEYQLIGARDHLKEKNEVDHLTVSFENTLLPLTTEDIKKVQPGLVVRLHNDICMSCYLGISKHLFDKLDKSGIPYSVLGSYPNSSKFRKQLKDLGTEAVSVNFPFMENYPPDKINIPYAFMLSPDGKIKNLFFLDKADSTLTNEYVGMIKRINAN